MAKLTRYLQKIFANNSNQVGVFGTGTDKEISKNVETLQSVDYENGWSSAIITNKNYPIWQERDGVDYGFSYQLAYLLQNGMPEWLSTETYYTNSFCCYGSKIYYSLQDDNTNHNPALNDGYWIEFPSDKANIDLSNLNIAGKDKVVALAHELDYANKISVATTSSNSIRTYTCPSDGILTVMAISATGTTKTVHSMIYDASEEFWYLENNINNATSTASIGTASYWTYLKNEVAHYKAYYSGSTGTISVNFIPFKKS